MKRMKKGILIFTMMFLFASCTGQDKAESNENVGEKETVAFQDDAERKIDLSNDIERIAPSGPLAQQVILSLAPDKIVAIAEPIKGDINQKILHKFIDLPKIGQFYGKLEFNVESLVEANPDIVIDIGEAKDSIVEDMDGIEEKSGKPAAFIEMTFNDANKTYRRLGELIGEEEKAEKLATYIERVQKEVKEGMEKVGDKKLSFVYLTGDNGLGSNPKGSFHMQVMDMFGDNVFVSKEKSKKGGSNEISMEELIKLDPDVIIFGPGSIYDKVKEDPAFSQLRAIKEGKFVEAPSTPYNWLGFPPSVNGFMGAQWLGKLFYPEVFNYDLQERITEYFDLFYGYQLSDEEYKTIVENSFFQ